VGAILGAGLDATTWQDCLSLKPYEKKFWLELDVNEMKSSSLAMLPCRDLDGGSFTVSCHKSIVNFSNVPPTCSAWQAS